MRRRSSRSLDPSSKIESPPPFRPRRTGGPPVTCPLTLNVAVWLFVAWTFSIRPAIASAMDTATNFLVAMTAIHSMSQLTGRYKRSVYLPGWQDGRREKHASDCRFFWAGADGLRNLTWEAILRWLSML